jgi:hypothetical protein
VDRTVWKRFFRQYQEIVCSGGPFEYSRNQSDNSSDEWCFFLHEISEEGISQSVAQCFGVFLRDSVDWIYRVDHILKSIGTLAASKYGVRMVAQGGKRIFMRGVKELLASSESFEQVTGVPMTIGYPQNRQNGSMKLGVKFNGGINPRGIKCH